MDAYVQRFYACSVGHSVYTQNHAVARDLANCVAAGEMRRGLSIVANQLVIRSPVALRS